jgi:hypothetical protein
MINKVKVEEAVGMTLAHDVTRVVPGFKGPAFRRGHVIKADDISGFLDIGKEHVFVVNLEEGEVHEEQAALRIARAVMGPGLSLHSTGEGRVDLRATQAGLVRVNVAALNRINSLGEMAVVTVHDATVCREGMVVAGMRIIPLYIREEKLAALERIAGAGSPGVSLAPFVLSEVGLIVTGSEVARGRIVDRFSPVLRAKVEAFGCKVNDKAIVGDDSDLIARTIREFRASGSEVILCTSGMSVDPDDVTPAGIRKSGDEVRFYDLPVLPGAHASSTSRPCS